MTLTLNEARKNTEEIIDALHAAGLTDGKKPRTYRIVAKKQYNGFSKSRRKTSRSIRRSKRQQLNYLRRNLKRIDTVIQNHPTKYVCIWDNSFAAYLAKKRAEGKHYNVAISHAAKKLVRLIFALQRSGNPYIPAT